MTQLVVFTDLDGTLLDKRDYGWAPAADVLSRLAELGVPVVLNSSKTAAEMGELRNELRNGHPFVGENGGALCIPFGYFEGALTHPGTPCDVTPCGVRYNVIREVLVQLREREGYRFRGFGDCTDSEVMAATGLDLESAQRARQRAATEPLEWLDSPERLEVFERAVREQGLQVTRGGRFVHVMGEVDKGRAVQQLLQRYRARFGDVVSVGLGDSPNDLPMLNEVDIAVVIPGGAAPNMQPQAAEVLRPKAPGPTGWAWAMRRILARDTN